MGLLVLDLLGTFVFGLSGAILAARKRMDLVGVLVLSTVAALGGGMVRDVLLGHVPPATLADWRYLLTAALAGVTVFAAGPHFERWRRPLRLFDAAGLGLFTVIGTIKALEAGLPPVPAALLGILTGVGGGALRDVLAREIPIVLRREVYASAALLGAVCIIVAERAGLPELPSAIAAAATIFTVRMLSIWLRWKVPVPPFGGPETTKPSG